jgi:hypothetical protein
MKPTVKLALYVVLVSCFALHSHMAQNHQAPPSREEPFPLIFADSAVAANPTIGEGNPSIAVKPNNGRAIVAVASLAGDPSHKCGAYRSFDGGETWKGPVLLPLRFPGDACTEAVVRWAPDSSFVYAVYGRGRGANGGHGEIVVSRSMTQGATWSRPVVALPGVIKDIPDGLDDPWLGVHTFPSVTAANSYVYVSAGVRNFEESVSEIRFARSTNHAASFQPYQTLRFGDGPFGDWVTRPKPIGGKGRDVLVCWLNGEPGQLHPGPRREDFGSSYRIDCSASNDFGRTFGTEFNAVERRFFAGGYPGAAASSLMITSDGTAHLAFVATPPDSDTDASDIYYVRSPQPYSSWTRPRRISHDPSGAFQHSPTITAKRLIGGSIVSVFWVDLRNSLVGSTLSDIYSASTLTAFEQDVRVSDISSLGGGARIDSSTSRIISDRTAHVIWTDRSDGEDDVYSDVVDLTP